MESGASHTLLVKNMVCHRCIMAVENVLTQQEVSYDSVAMGEIHLPEILSDDKYHHLSDALQAIGLELLDNRQNGLMEKIKHLVIAKARNELPGADSKKNLSELLSDKLFREYTYMSSLFSSIEGRTIENFYISHRIEKVKELLVYGEMNLSEIAAELDYSSVSHLSSQFKKITGLTPTHFIKIAHAKRNLLDKV